MQSLVSDSKKTSTAPPKADIYFLQNKPPASAALPAASPKETGRSAFIWHGIGLIKGGTLPVFSAPFDININDIQLKKLTKKICCVIDSRDAVIATEEFPTQLSGSVLQMAVREHLQANGLWIPGQEMKLHLKHVKESGQNRLYNITIIPSQEIDGILEHPNLQAISLDGILDIAHCVSGLISALLSEPAIVLYCDHNHLRLMAVGNNMVYFLQILPYEISDMLPAFMLNQAMEIAKINIQRLYGLEIKHVLALGPRYDICPPVINEIELFKPDWQKVLTAPSYEDVTRFPGLYGAYFADRSVDFMPKSWRYAVTVQKIGMVATLVAAVLAVGMGGYGAYLYKLNQDQTIEYQNLFNALSVRQAAISAKLPPDTTKTELENWLKLQQAAFERPRLDEILAYIADAMEPDISLVALSISAMPQGQTQAPPGANQPSSQQVTGIQNLPTGPFQITLQLESKGTFEDTRVRINSTLSRLCSRFQLEEPEWQYDENKQLCAVTCRMTPKTPRPNKETSHEQPS